MGLFDFAADILSAGIKTVVITPIALVQDVADTATGEEFDNNTGQVLTSALVDLLSTPESLRK